jgi:hypothetical protein
MSDLTVAITGIDLFVWMLRDRKCTTQQTISSMLEHNQDMEWFKTLDSVTQTTIYSKLNKETAKQLKERLV